MSKHSNYILKTASNLYHLLANQIKNPNQVFYPPTLSANSARSIETAPISKWRNGEMTLRVFNSCNVPTNLIGQYSVVFSKVFSEHHSYLNAPNMADVLSQGNGVAFAMRGSEVVAGLYFARNTTENHSGIKIMGLVSNGEVPRIAAPLTSAALLSEIALSSKPLLGKAVVRLMPKGDLNYASCRALCNAGFAPIRQEISEVDDSNVHLHLTSEPDGRQFRFLSFLGDQRNILNASRITLEGWEPQEHTYA